MNSRLMRYAALLVGLAGCATPQKPDTLAVTFVSVPAGAMLVQNGAIMGQMPVTLVYSLSQSDVSRGSMQSVPMTARWISGATATVSTAYTWTPGQNKLTGRTVFHRPASAPGLDTDMAVEARLRQEAEPTADELEMWRSLGEALGGAAAARKKR
jgi:hypothetical protein